MPAGSELPRALLLKRWRRNSSPIALSWCWASSSTTRIIPVRFFLLSFPFNSQYAVFSQIFLHSYVQTFLDPTRHCVRQWMGSGSGDCGETGPSLEDTASPLSPSSSRWPSEVSDLFRRHGTRDPSGSGLNWTAAKHTNLLIQVLFLQVRLYVIVRLFCSCTLCSTTLSWWI